MSDQVTPNPRPRCPVCSSPHKAQIHALKASKMPLEQIHLETQKLGRGIKRETLGKHFRICLKGITPELLAQEIADAGKVAQSQAEVDFAVMVQKRATELLAKGELRVTAQHGLQAQALLDRRAEKQADRDVAINIARLLSGAMIMPPTTVIEGRVIDVSPPELGDGLAPLGVYEVP
jgi:hypothetical protein